MANRELKREFITDTYVIGAQRKPGLGGDGKGGKARQFTAHFGTDNKETVCRLHTGLYVLVFYLFKNSGRPVTVNQD